MNHEGLIQDHSILGSSTTIQHGTGLRRPWSMGHDLAMAWDDAWQDRGKSPGIELEPPPPSFPNPKIWGGSSSRGVLSPSQTA